jgi:hypothetical protein
MGHRHTKAPFQRSQQTELDDPARPTTIQTENDWPFCWRHLTKYEVEIFVTNGAFEEVGVVLGARTRRPEQPYAVVTKGMFARHHVLWWSA